MNMCHDTHTTSANPQHATRVQHRNSPPDSPVRPQSLVALPGAVGQMSLLSLPPQRSRRRPGKRNITHAGIVGGYHVAITAASHLESVKVFPAVMDAELLVRCDVPVCPEYDGPPVAVHADADAHVWVAVVIDEPRPVPVFSCSW